MIAVACFVLGVLAGITFMAVCFALSADPSLCRESLSERHDRLDAEAAAATSEEAR